MLWKRIRKKTRRRKPPRQVRKPDPPAPQNLKFPIRRLTGARMLPPIPTPARKKPPKHRSAAVEKPPSREKTSRINRGPTHRTHHFRRPRFSRRHHQPL